MADVPNKELVPNNESEAVDVYDSKHGKYEDKQGQNTAPGAAPANQPSPFKLGG
jgi:hypothetical protein